MSLPINLDLQVVVGQSFAGTATLSSAAGAQLGFLGATAELRIGISAYDPQPLIDVTTTSGAEGGIVLGVTFPPTGGVAVSNGAGLEQLGQIPSGTWDLPQVSLSVASVAALEATATGAYILGTLAFVSAAAGAYYAWSPLDPSTPNGTTILAGAGGTGCWLWAGTFSLSLTATATAALVGYDYAQWGMLVTFGDGEVVEVVSGRVYAFTTPPA